MKNYKKISIIKSKGRLINEANSPYRSPFQRDRDRIIHSSAFRRLKHKTQVFVNTEGDHYRTRITHSIEVAQIARTISRYLNLNDDLTETLSLAHDLGHTPFGHAGEDALNDCMIKYGGFDHNLQTLRIVMFIEKKYVRFNGLNLTLETLDGLLKHNGPYYDKTDVENLIGIKNLKKKINLETSPSLEAQIASISDDIAYNNHDIQDGYMANLFKIKELNEINFFKELLKKYYKKSKNIDGSILIYQMVRDSINLMVKDLIQNSMANFKINKIKKLNDVYRSENKLICFSSSYEKIIEEIRDFLKLKMYKNKKVLKRNNEGKKIIQNLFKVISNNPKKFLTFKSIKHNKYRSIADYISGMTDRFAINIYKSTKWTYLKNIK